MADLNKYSDFDNLKGIKPYIGTPPIGGKSDNSVYNNDSNQNPKPGFERYLELISQLGNLTYSPNRIEDSNLKKESLDGFFIKHFKLTFDEFIDSSKPEGIQEDSYGLFNRGSIKRSLFKERSRLYTLAMNQFEEEGGDLSSIIDKIRNSYIPMLKKSEGTEPTIEAILDAMILEYP